MKVKFTLLAIMLVFAFALPAAGQDNPVPRSFQNAIVVNSLDDIGQVTVAPDEEIIYRLAQCSTSETDTCFVRVYAQESRNLSLAINVATRFFKPLSQQSQATLICGYTQYNGLGQILWEIRNQQPTTFYNQYGHSPFSWDSLPNDSYQAYGGYTWGDGVVSINPSTAGQQAQVGHSSVVRQLKFLGIDQGNKTAFIYFDTPGGTWNCLAG